MPQLSDDEWRTVLELSDAAADLPIQDRRRFLESSGAPAAIVAQVLNFLANLGSESETPNRIGLSIDRFIVTAYCGGGGAGDVYQATDTELRRTVALKLLRPAILEKSGAVDRFIREARTVSALNHPNIVTIYEVVRSGQELAIVMEFVDGTPLRALCGSPLPLTEVLSIGRQFAAALSAAHERGIVHRDIKPENAIRRPNGSLKILDFGLATTFSQRPEIESGFSLSHQFAGTWRYMSPEQIAGESITPASDVYSFGLVLCELATGTLKSGALSASGSVPQSRSRLVAGPSPDLRSLPKSLRSLLLCMLARSPRLRPTAQAVADRLSAFESDWITRGRRRSSRLILATSIAFVAALLIYAGCLLWLNRSRPALLASAISVEPGYRWSLTFSPDGDHLAYAWDRPGEPRQVYFQNIDGQTGRASSPARLTQDPRPEDLPAWSPDGKTVAFHREVHSGTELILHDFTTGRERRLTGFDGRSLVWSRDGKWLIASTGKYLVHAITLISPLTGEQHLLTLPKGQTNDDNPTAAPNNRSVSFVRFFSDSLSRLANVPLNPNGPPDARPFLFVWPGFDAGVLRYPVYGADGHDLFFIAETGGIDRIWRSHDSLAPVLLASLGERITNLAIPIHRNRIAFLRNLDDTNIWKVQLVADGAMAAGSTSQVIATSRLDQRPAVSPDGSQIAFESNRGGYLEVWITTLATGEAWQLTNLKTQCGSPRWSPDGHWIVFDGRVQTSSSVFKIPASGGSAQRLTFSFSASDLLPVFSPDGHWIYFASNRNGKFQIWRILASGGAPSLQTEVEATAPELSKDGQKLYYLERLWSPSTLWQKDLVSSQLTRISDSVFFRAFTVGRKLVYFSRSQPNGTLRVFTWSEPTKEVHPLATLPSATVAGLSLSPDEKSLYFAQLDAAGDELLLVSDY